LPLLNTAAHLPSDHATIVQVGPARDGQFEIVWSARRGRGGRRDLTPAAALWLARSMDRLTNGFDWRRFQEVAAGTFPLATAPRDELRWDSVAGTTDRDTFASGGHAAGA